MGFLIKAGFWFGVVLMFLPSNKELLRPQREMAQHSAQKLIEVATASAEFCKEQPEICKSALESSKLAGNYMELAADEIAALQQEAAKQTPTP